eukprot:3612733-Pleurochrysis_carterae.AAC.3
MHAVVIEASSLREATTLLSSTKNADGVARSLCRSVSCIRISAANCIRLMRSLLCGHRASFIPSQGRCRCAMPRSGHVPGATVSRRIGVFADVTVMADNKLLELCIAFTQSDNTCLLQEMQRKAPLKSVALLCRLREHCHGLSKVLKEYGVTCQRYGGGGTSVTRWHLETTAAMQKQTSTTSHFEPTCVCVHAKVLHLSLETSCLELRNTVSAQSHFLREEFQLCPNVPYFCLSSASTQRPPGDEVWKVLSWLQVIQRSCHANVVVDDT